MKKLLFLGLFLSASLAYSQQVSLTGNAQVSVITFGPFQEELYSAFGHSAIRVHDPNLGIDIAYNYGVFDFDQPNFYLNFARGFLYYKLGTYPYPLFRDYYVSYNRFVHEQVLDLTAEQKQKIADYLQWNALPENQNYRYDYFYNNCATKVRDVFAEVFKGEINFNDSYIKSAYTVRDLTHSYLQYQPWGELGIEICLGLPMDKTLTPYQYMFMPDFIESGFDHATLDGRPIVKEKILTFESTPETPARQWLTPLTIFSGILIVAIALTFFDWRRKKLSKWFDVILFSVTGLVGFLLLFLWFFTDHQAASPNFNLLWALPTNLIAAFLLLKRKLPLWLGKYFMVITIIENLTLLGWLFLPQHLNIFLFPLIVAIVVRSIWIYLFSFENMLTNG